MGNVQQKPFENRNGTMNLNHTPMTVINQEMENDRVQVTNLI